VVFYFIYGPTRSYFNRRTLPKKEPRRLRFDHALLDTPYSILKTNSWQSCQKHKLLTFGTYNGNWRNPDYSIFGWTVTTTTAACTY
jgi:hypothetical protein